MTLNFLVEVYDPQGKKIAREGYSDDRIEAMGLDTALWRAVREVPKDGHLIWGHSHENEIIDPKKIVCVKPYDDDESIDGIYILVERGMGKTHFYNKKEYDQSIVRSLQNAVTFLYEHEYIEVNKAVEVQGGEDHLSILRLERVS
ncbi:hypothetical protein [Asaia astilbis]|uniref:hypothetical protein n=1 Tax=Asaia astilbis TaxID=610244 RepID=UPI000472AE91|nr:hypothetical protein [Asaia astilbis]